MTAILTNVEAGQILLGSGRPYVRELAEILESVRADNLRASEVISHIRHFVSNNEVAAEPFDMNAVVRTVARLALPSAMRFGVDLRVACADIPPARGDSVHMQQVLLNLVLNAMDAMRDTPPEARIIGIATRGARDGHIEVSVGDRGHGIPSQDMDRIFDSFFTTREHGMGLGLSIAHSLVTAHGGRIWAENNAEGGATFRFTIPADGPPR
jgi:two-component system sensor kinase FixL